MMKSVLDQYASQYRGFHPFLLRKLEKILNLPKDEIVDAIETGKLYVVYYQHNGMYGFIWS